MIAVKIKAGSYGKAIGMLLQRGAGFQTRFERTLIVNAEQHRLLEEAGFVATNGLEKKAGKGRGKKTK